MNQPKIPKIYFNAEFQRLIWLNFSIPLFCVIIFCYAFFGYNAVEYHDGYRFEKLQEIAVVGFWFSNIAMAIMLQRSFKQDIQSQFWDQLRMSTLTSWQLSWTRLWITPVLAWLSILICMLLMYLGTILYVPTEYNYSMLPNDYESHIIIFVLMMPMFTICCASLFIINELQFKRSQYEWNGSYFQLGLLAIVGGLFLGSTVDRFRYNSHLEILPFLNGYSDLNVNTNMWHLFSYAILATVIALFFLNKSMSYKLHLKSTHIYWLIIAFILPYLLVMIDAFALNSYLKTESYDYAQGVRIEMTFAKSSVLLYYFSIYSILIYSIVCGISLVCQDNRPQTFKLAMQYFKVKQWRMMLEILPTWVILLPVALITMGALAVMIPMIDADFYQTVIKPSIAFEYTTFSFFNFASQLVIYMGIIFSLYHISLKIAPRFNSVSLSLIGFILLYLMWHMTRFF